MKYSRVWELITSPVALVGAIVVVGVMIRLRGVTWGLPYLYDPDEHFLVDPAVCRFSESFPQ